MSGQPIGGSVEIEDGRHVFAPGDELAGSASWRLPSDPEAVELRLSWRTEGRGDTDRDVVARERFDAPGKQDWRPFTFRLPDGPYSFSGALISLTWELELVAEPFGEVGRTEIVVSPTGAELRLAALDAEEDDKPGKAR